MRVPSRRWLLLLTAQCCFHHALHRMAFVDTDEYIMLKNGSRDLPGYLRQFEKEHPAVGGLAVSWLMFGSGGRKQRPASGGVVANYRLCSADKHVKTIVTLEHVASTAWSPHHFHYRGPHYAMDPNGKRVDGPFNPGGPTDTIFIAHYHTKSAEEYAAKVKLGSAWQRSRKKAPHGMARVDAAAQRNCTETLAYANVLDDVDSSSKW